MVKQMGGGHKDAREVMKVRSRGQTRARAQSIVEFALVVPVLLFMLFGAMEGGLLLFVVGTAKYGAEEMARQESQSANSATADQDSIAALRKTALGSSTLAHVNEIDIYRMVEQPDGSLVADPNHYNRYNLDGTCLGACASNTWPSIVRNVTNDQSDFLGVTLQVQYNWMTGKMLAGGPVALSETFVIRLEPQTY